MPINVTSTSVMETFEYDNRIVRNFALATMSFTVTSPSTASVVAAFDDGHQASAHGTETIGAEVRHRGRLDEVMVEPGLQLRRLVSLHVDLLRHVAGGEQAISLGGIGHR